MNEVSEKNENTLGELKLVLDLIDITNEYYPKGKDLKVEHLLLPLNINITAPLKIQLHYLNDLDKERGIDLGEGLLLLQFFIEIPLKISEDKVFSVVMLFIRLNGLIPFGNFGITDEGLYFRFVYPSKDRVKDNGLMVLILDSISRYVSAIVPNLVGFINDQKTLENSFKSSVKNIQEIIGK